MNGWPSYPSEAPNGVAKPAAAPVDVGNPAAPPTTPAKPMARLRLNTVGDIAKEYRKLYREARAGTLATSEASKLGYLLSALAGVLATSQLEERLAALEGAKPSR